MYFECSNNLDKRKNKKICFKIVKSNNLIFVISGGGRNFEQ